MNRAAIITGVVSLALLLTSLIAFFHPMTQVAVATFIIGVTLALVALFLSSYSTVGK